jgi:two-component system, cell cycle sensor histidine kinase DivJ
MHPSGEPRSVENYRGAEQSASKLDPEQNKFKLIIKAIALKIWAEDSFSRSRSYALCAGLALLPFVLISGLAKSLHILLVACIILLPVILSLACAGTLGMYRALQIQFGTILVLALAGLYLDLGIGVSLGLLLLAAIDFLIFAPKQALTNIHTRIGASSLVGAAVLTFIFAFISARMSAAQMSVLSGSAYLTIIPLFVQIAYGLLKLRDLGSSVPLSTSLSPIDKLALKASDELALIVDRSGRVVSAGSNAQNILATHATSLLGRGLFERLHPVDRPALLMACGKINSVNQMSEVPLRLTSGDASKSTLPLNYALFVARMSPIMSPIEANDGTCLLMLREVMGASNYDMSFLSSTSQSAPEDDPLARVKLLTEISHDVRTPLNAIMGFSELLSDVSRQPKSAGAIAEYGQIIQRSSKDLLEIVTHLIDLTRLENGVFRMMPETLSPNDVLNQADTIIAEKLDTSSLKMSLSGALHTVDWTVDKRAARQVLTTIATALIQQSQSLDLKIDVTVINTTLCFALSCQNSACQNSEKTNSQDWQFKSITGKSITGLPISMEIARVLARVMGGSAELKLSTSGKHIAEVQFPLECPSAIMGESGLVQLSKFRDSRSQKPSPSSSNSSVRKHA